MEEVKGVSLHQTTSSCKHTETRAYIQASNRQQKNDRRTYRHTHDLVNTTVRVTIDQQADT